MRKLWSVLLVQALLVASVLMPAPVQAESGRELDGQLTGQGGQPLAGREVELFQFGAGRIGSGRTDDGGYFHFSGLDETAVYWVRAWAPEYRFAEGTWTAGQASFLALNPAPLTGALAVRAVDPETGDLLSGAGFDLLRIGQGQVVLAEGTEGAARLEAPAGGGYTLRAWAPGRNPVIVAVSDLVGGVTRPVAVELPAAAGRVAGVAVAAQDGTALAGATVQAVRSGYGVVAAARARGDGSFAFDLPTGAEYQVRVAVDGYAGAATAPFTLAPGSVRDFSGEQQVAAVPATGTLSGRLLDPDGRPLKGRTVWLERKPFGIVAAIDTDDHGRFRFEGVPTRAGLQYRVQVLAQGSNWRSATSPWSELPAGKVTDVALKFTDGTAGIVDGTGGVIGTVMAAGGRPLADVQVELWREGVGLVATQTTASDGSFKLGDIAANRSSVAWATADNGYYLKVSAPGRFTATVGVDSALDVQPDRDTAVNITLYAQQVSVTGRVLDGEGRPVPGATLSLEPEAGGQTINARVAANGRWRAVADPLARYRVKATRDGYYDAVAADLVADPAGAGARDVVLKPQTADLWGVVGDAYGKPVTDALVTAWSPGRAYTATTDSRGRWSVPVQAGDPYLLTAAAGGAGSGLSLQGSAAPIWAPGPGERAEINLQLWDSVATVQGTVRDGAGKSVSGAAVELVREGQGPVAVAQTDAAGRYRFERVAPDARYVVRTARGAYRYAGNPGLPQPELLVPGTVLNVHLELPSTAQ